MDLLMQINHLLPFLVHLFLKASARISPLERHRLVSFFVLVPSNNHHFNFIVAFLTPCRTHYVIIFPEDILEVLMLISTCVNILFIILLYLFPCFFTLVSNIW